MRHSANTKAVLVDMVFGEHRSHPHTKTLPLFAAIHYYPTSFLAAGQSDVMGDPEPNSKTLGGSAEENRFLLVVLGIDG
jgi:hypothetical protein